MIQETTPSGQETSQRIERRKAKDAVEKNRVTLFNIDLEINAVATEIEVYKARRERYKDNPTSKGKKAFFGATVEKKKAERFVRALAEAKRKLMAGLGTILDSYAPRDKEIWLMYFMSLSTVDEIAEKTNWCKRRVEKTIARMKDDIISYDRMTKKEEKQ